MCPIMKNSVITSCHILNELCHTLILSGDNRLSTFGFLLVELSCLTQIVAQSIGFCDVSKGNVQNIHKKGKMVTLGTFSNPWSH